MRHCTRDRPHAPLRSSQVRPAAPSVALGQATAGIRAAPPARTGPAECFPAVRRLTMFWGLSPPYPSSGEAMVVLRGTESLLTRRWREPDSNLYGAFPVKPYFWFVAGSLFGAGKPFFVPSPAMVRGARRKGSRDRNGSKAWWLAA